MQFHEDPRFTKLQEMRDASFDVFSDGHLFRPIDKTVTLSIDSDHAIVISDDNPLDAEPIFELPLADDSPVQAYAGKSMRLFPWDAATEQLLSRSPSEITVLRLRFNPPG